MKLTQFSAPASVNDFGPATQEAAAWSEFISSTFDDAVNRVEAKTGPGLSQFYNPMKVDTDAQSASKVISWIGFPKVLLKKHGANRQAAWADAEQLRSSGGVAYRMQDEYLEWHVTKNAAGKVTRVEFTCEGPEYWQFLAQNIPDKLLQLYQTHVSTDVKKQDLFGADGSYNGSNIWNTQKGAMHLTHPANTLTAEIFIAGDATVLRQKGGQVLADADQLIRCAQYGVPDRASDPRIGSDVNTLARAGFAITLADPVGLYIAGINTTGWQKPDGTPVGNYWKVLRGSDSSGLRAVYEVPTAEGFVVGDIKIGANNIAFGGQIAENITMKLTGVACRQGSFHDGPHACEGTAGAIALSPHPRAVSGF
jgi:hypothetical protein